MALRMIEAQKKGQEWKEEWDNYYKKLADPKKDIAVMRELLSLLRSRDSRDSVMIIVEQNEWNHQRAKIMLRNHFRAASNVDHENEQTLYMFKYVQKYYNPTQFVSKQPRLITKFKSKKLLRDKAL